MSNLLYLGSSGLLNFFVVSDAYKHVAIATRITHPPNSIPCC